MIRDIIHIDEDKCNGCGLCITACHEGAIELIDGKARLIGDEYCDGLGDCLPECPVDAISIIQRKGKAFDQEAVQRRLEELKEQKEDLPCGCPGSMAREITRSSAPVHSEKNEKEDEDFNREVKSELRQWPVQLSLINTRAPYLQGAHLLIAADCTAYAYGDFHRDFIKDRITIIGCPKLDDNNYYREKLAEILINNNISSITVVRMEVPCCSGIVASVKGAMLDTGLIVPYSEVTIGTQGNII